MSDSLSRNTETLLENCSGYFHTKPPQNLRVNLQLLKNVRLHQNQLFVKNLLIQLSADSLKPINTSQDISLMWDTKNATVTSKKDTGFQLFSFNNGKVAPVETNNIQQRMQLKKEGALLVDF
jgi:hypothetical protein